MNNWRLVLENYKDTGRFELKGDLVLSDTDRLLTELQGAVKLVQYAKETTDVVLEVDCSNLVINGHGTKDLLLIHLQLKASTPQVNLKLTNIQSKFRHHFKPFGVLDGGIFTFGPEERVA